MNKLFEYLRYNSYRSVRHKLFYVATPKVACTTLKWWFAGLEGCAGEIRNFKESAESDPDLIIHDAFHQVCPKVTGLSPVDIAEVLSAGDYFRFAVVSNPYRRIFSAWQSKLLLREPLLIGPYLDYDFIHHPIECKNDIAAAFEGFLNHLAANESPDFLDLHWTPQATLLRPDIVNYTKLVKIEDTKELSHALAERLGSSIPDPFTGPRLNESMIPYGTEFLTERSIELIRKLYSVDFETFGYDTQPPGNNRVFTDEQFNLVRVAIKLIRGRHQRLSEHQARIRGLNQQLAQEELTIREKEVSINQKGEELGVKREELRVKSEELRVKGEELRVKNEELRVKSEELKGKSEEINRQKTELSRIKSELKQTANALDQATSDLNDKKAELSQKIAELTRKTLELDSRTTELHAKTGELDQKAFELTQKSDEIHQKTDELDQKNAELEETKAELLRRDNELSQKTEQLDRVLTSKSWVLTKPVRLILDAAGRVAGKTRHLFTNIPAIIRFNGGIKNVLKKTIRVLRKEGIHSLRYHYKMQSGNAGKEKDPVDIQIQNTLSSGTEAATGLSDGGKKENEKKFHSSASILFIGHDARLAGAQVLLLSLVRWFREHTGLGIKVILLQDGVLLEKYRLLAPTVTWEEMLRQHPDKEERRNAIKDFAGKTNLIYGNTVLSPAIYDELEFLKAPFITHVHELEQSIKLYVEKSTIAKMKSFTTGYIACTEPVCSNLLLNHSVDKEKIVTIHDFIEERQVNFDTPRPELRKKAGYRDTGMIVIGCGPFYWRKGGDLFIETALKLTQKGLTDFHFYWIGENIWDQDLASFNLSSWDKLQRKIRENGLDDHLTFLGVKDDVYDYMQAADVFYLPSREDPFPLVGLIAAQCGIPVICFADAGGMPGFVEKDAGFVVPFEDVNAAADKILLLHQNPTVRNDLGACARKKFLQRHSIENAGPEILHYCRKTGNFQPTMSVIVPNYNCEKFLGKRMESIFSQSFRDFEVILLDDASTDRSLEILEKYLHFPDVRLVKNPSNSGSPFVQWQRGIAEARGEIIWIAEADDFCKPDFLSKLLPCFNDASVALAYCDSAIIDENGSVTGSYEDYYRSLDPDHWRSSYQVSGTREINYGLGIKNSIPNASAVLLRKIFIPRTSLTGSKTAGFAGDWMFYTQVIKGKQIAFLSEKLNFHRKHRKTVTSDFNTDKGNLLLKEAGVIHSNIIGNYSIDAGFLQKWEYYITEQIRAFYPDARKGEFDTWYPYTLIEGTIKDAILQSKNSKRLVFITTNDGSPNGGSEQLWRKAAIECSKRGHEVMVVIKKWDPEPFFLKDFREAGITVTFKDPDHFVHVRNFSPDLVVISLGDQDEGIGYYEQCKINGIRYVIVNQLTKEPKYWPVNNVLNEEVKEGYLGSEAVLFTGQNNREVMEKRLNCKIPHAGIFYNPFDIDRNADIPFPAVDKGFNIAMVGNLHRIHKGQHLALELFQLKKWRDRPLHLNIYGQGIDEVFLKKQAEDFQMKNVTFHGHTNDIPRVWKENHAILMPSQMEGLPLALVGAMIAGRVPVVTDIGAHREVIEDNVNGFIAAEPTIEALDEALERAWQRSADWKSIGMKARKSILKIVPEDPVDHFIRQLIPFFTGKS